MPCQSPGEGGVAQDTLPEPAPVPSVSYDGILAFSDADGTSQCPRNGQLLATIQSSSGTPVSYRIDCSNGLSSQGTAQLSPGDPGDYQALITENFLIDQSETISCALKRLDGDQTHLLAIAGEQFSCVTPAVPPQTGDFAPK